jgi:hypothetical protein
VLSQQRVPKFAALIQAGFQDISRRNAVVILIFAGVDQPVTGSERTGDARSASTERPSEERSRDFRRRTARYGLIRVPLRKRHLDVVGHGGSYARRGTRDVGPTTQTQGAMSIPDDVAEVTVYCSSQLPSRIRTNC